MDEVLERIVDRCRILYGEEEAAKEAFLFCLESIVYDVLSYCNLDINEWPKSLDHTVILMVQEVTNELKMLNNESVGNDVKSISEGDFSITKETFSEKVKFVKDNPSFARNYKVKLNQFRKLGK